MIDLCGAPGGWTQYLAQKLPKSSKILLLDLAMVSLDDLENVSCLQCDITTKDAVDQAKAFIAKQTPPIEGVDLVLSDCSPKMGGNYATDHARQIYLAMHAFRIAVLLKAKVFVAKAFDGTDLSILKTLLTRGYEDLRIHKPKASRSSSAELYLVAKGLKEGYLPPEDF